MLLLLLLFSMVLTRKGRRPTLEFLKVTTRARKFIVLVRTEIILRINQVTLLFLRVEVSFDLGEKKG